MSLVVTLIRLVLGLLLGWGCSALPLAFAGGPALPLAGLLAEGLLLVGCCSSVAAVAWTGSSGCCSEAAVALAEAAW